MIEALIRLQSSEKNKERSFVNAKRRFVIPERKGEPNLTSNCPLSHDNGEKRKIFPLREEHCKRNPKYGTLKKRKQKKLLEG